MFYVTMCLPSAANQRTIRALCAEYFSHRSETVQIRIAAADADQIFLGSDLIFLSAIGTRPNGLDIAAHLRGVGCLASIVFLAAGPEYAMEAFSLSALQYLIPPVPPVRLYETLDRTLLRRRGPALAVTTQQGLMRIAYADIEYVECTDHVLHFHLTNGSLVRSTTQRAPLAQSLAPLLVDQRFYQPHRSYVVNLDAVQLLKENEFLMQGGARVPVPRSHAAQARALYLAAMQPEGPFLPK